VVLVHGLNDWLIPIEAARVLFERFPGPKVMLETYGGHNRAGLGEEDSLAAALARFWAVAAEGGDESE
jgi:hypothetical protein